MTAATIPNSLRPRLGQFVRLLGSDQPGEVVAAAAALRRALAGAGADLHDLAGSIERPAEPKVWVEREPAHQQRRGRRSHLMLDARRAREIAGILSRASAQGSLSAWEESFTASVLPTLRGHAPRLSVRQYEVVERLVSKHGEPQF